MSSAKRQYGNLETEENTKCISRPLPLLSSLAGASPMQVAEQGLAPSTDDSTTNKANALPQPHYLAVRFLAERTEEELHTKNAKVKPGQKTKPGQK
ncbi:MAG: hypothetical protein M1829_000505 [Trizodia sp. TS-e1964]|nr:MAG: hypothetical protein M1829_000505 [Trizodia sp. TS-e1964]